MSERDMTVPVTRGEMHKALETWAGAILAQFKNLITRQDVLRADMLALVKASERHVLDQMKAMFDPHRSIPDRINTLERAELPERVGKLEAKVFAPRRRASKTGRRRTR